MSRTVTTRASIDEAAVATVQALISAAITADGVSPLNERATLQLEEPGTHLVVTGEASAPSTIVAYGQVDPSDATVQLVVHPAHRRQGIGRALHDHIALELPQARFWAFGNLPAARALAAATHQAVVRELLILERPLTDLPAAQARPGILIRPYTSVDADAVVAVNAAAFSDHPEQGAMDRADFERRLVLPSDIIVAVDGDSGEVIGFHWTKQHGDGLGEVYVIGVTPTAAGRGLGRTLLWAGLAHLAQTGCQRVILYVEGDNTPAVRLYQSSGFRTVHTDALYASPPQPSEGEIP